MLNHGIDITQTAGWYENYLFSMLIGLCLISAYRLLGAGWLIMKTEGALQLMAVQWAKSSLWLTAAGVQAISVATRGSAPAFLING